MKNLSFLAAAFYFTGLSPIMSQTNWVPFDQSGRQDFEITNITSGADKVEFTLTLHGMYVTDTVVNSTLFRQIHIPGATSLGITGHPALPGFEKKIAIPGCSGFNITYSIQDSLSYTGYHVFPQPLVTYDTTAGQYIRIDQFSYDSAAYSQNYFSPDTLIWIPESGALRSQSIAVVNFTPLRYKPAADTLVVYKTILFTVEFNNPEGEINSDVGLFGNIANKILLNYNLNSRPASSVYNPSYQGSVTWIDQIPSNANTLEGDYLIITDPQFFTPNFPGSPLYQFAQYRASQSKMDVTIVRSDQVLNYGSLTPNERRVRKFIKDMYDGGNAANTFDGRLAYVLLVGDVIDAGNNTIIPAAKDQHPGSNVQGVPIPNDYYYSCLTIDQTTSDFDMVGDVFIGRFSVNNANELNNLFQKIKWHETEVLFTDCYTNYMNCNVTEAQPWFTCWGWNGPPSECYRDHLNGVYPSSSYQTKGPHIPVPNGSGGYNCQDSVFQDIKDGLIMMIMMGHSSENNLLSCSYNAYVTALNMFEQDRFPFCLAHTCLTGSYDNTTSLGGEDCFAERITTYSQTKGFVGMLASSLKISWLNAYQWGTGVLGKLPEAVWKDFSTIAGEFILEAKISSNYLILEHKEILFNLNYFGDPALNLFPSRFLITEETEIPDGSVISSPVYVQYPGALKISDNHTVYFENNGRIIVEESAILKIGNNVTLWGSNPDNRIEVFGNMLDMTGKDTLTDVTFTALQTENNHQWGGLWVDNQNDLTFIDCNLNHGSYVFDCDSVELTEGTDSSSIIHTTGKNSYARITGVDFIDSQVLCDYPDDEVFPEVYLSGNGFTNDRQMDYTIRLSQVPLFSIVQNTIYHKGLIGIDLQNIKRTASSGQLIENNMILNTGTPPDSSIGINLYNYRANILNGNNISNHDYGVACIRSSNVAITGNPYASLNTAQSISNNYKYQIKAFNSSFPLNLHFNKLTNSVSGYARIYHYNDGSVPSIPPEDGALNVVCNYWGTGFNCDEDLYPANGYNCDGVWPPFPCQYFDGGQELYETASNAADNGNFTLASNLMDSLIATWPNSDYSMAAVRDYYGIEETGSGNFSSLKQRYLSDTLFFQTEDLQRAAEFMVKECNLRLGYYEEAMTWLENEVTEPFNSADSICALIDMGFVNTLMNNNGLKSGRTIAPNGERLPSDLRQNEQWYRNLLLKLFNDTDFNNSGNLPEDEKSEQGINLIYFGPNPLKDEMLTIKVNSDFSDNAVIDILSIDGKVMKSQIISLNKGCEAIEQIYLGDIPAGIFIIRIMSSKTKESVFRKLIII